MRILLALLAALWLAACGPRPEPVDTLLFGGPIYTGEGETPVEALAIRAGRVAFAGPLTEAERLSGPTTARIDLRGAAAFPGFVDAHAHLRGIGERELTLNLEGVASLEELQRRVAERVALAPKGEAIIGRGWIETKWPEARFPTAADLDRVAPSQPVLLVRADGHALVANSAALQAAGITAATAAPAGGEILKNARGQPTGILIDRAMELVAALRPEGSADARRQALQTGLQVYARYGWVGLHNMSVPWEDVLQLEAFTERGRLPLRVYNAVTPEASAELLASGPRRTPDGQVITRAIKYYVDGALGSRGAALFEPYADAAASSGLLLLTPDEAAAAYQAALRAGLQIATHAIGDRGNALVLDWYDQALAAVPATERTLVEPRWRVEHAQVLRPADIPRFRALGAIASMQPSHAIGDLHFAPARLGGDRLNGAYAWASLVHDGAVVAGGSDAPVERGDPLIEFYAAVARKDLEGFAGPDWHPEQALDRLAALRLFTAAPAYAAFEEAERGTLEVGNFADVSVFSVDLMRADAAEIPQGKALLTLIEGKQAFRAEGW